LVFRAWWGKGLHQAKSYQPPGGSEKLFTINRLASTINLAVCRTNEFELIVDESGTSFYAELSDKHSNNRIGTGINCVENLIRLPDDTVRSISSTIKRKNETMITPL
jgi:hypothetical protein